MFGGETINANFIIFGLIWQGTETTIYWTLVILLPRLTKFNMKFKIGRWHWDLVCAYGWKSLFPVNKVELESAVCLWVKVLVVTRHHLGVFIAGNFDWKWLIGYKVAVGWVYVRKGSSFTWHGCVVLEIKSNRLLLKF